jgi:hypothetical protein
MKELLVETPPKYDALTPHNRSASNTCLVIYAVLMTTLLIISVAAGVGLYVVRVSPSAVDVDSLLSHVEEFSVDGQTISQRVQLDAECEVEVLRYDDSGAILVLDFKRGLTALFAPSAGECYLVGGIGRRFPSPFTQHDVEEATEDVEMTTLYYQKSSSYPVMEHSVLPPHLTTQCQQLPVFWMEAALADNSESRVKRSNSKLCLAALAGCVDTICSDCRISCFIA